MVVAIIILGSAVLFFYPVTVTYEVNETYYEQESIQKSLSYQVIGTPIYHSTVEGLSNIITVGEVEIKNTDTESGTFSVNCQFVTLKRGTLTDQISLSINAGENKVAKCRVDTNLGEDVNL